MAGDVQGLLEAGFRLFLWRLRLLQEIGSGRNEKANRVLNRIDLVDQMGQQIEGTLHAGNPFRLRVLDPSDFRVILSLLNGFGHAAA